MKFLRLRIPAFGQLRDLDTGPDELPGLVVIQGRNESGKSTFFSAVQSLLFGLYPADRDRHPYTPWSGETARLEGDIQLADGSRFAVQRRLLSTPHGVLQQGDGERQIRNSDLDVARHVKKEVYEQIFALDLAEMASLEGSDWDDVQDRLFGGMGVKDLRPARAVAEELETEAGRLWRTSGRGNQEIRDLEKIIRNLGARRREARDEDDRVRSLHAELLEARERREILREERHTLAARRERLEELAPLRSQLARIHELEEELAGGPDVDDLPTDPAARISELADRVAELGRALEESDREIAVLQERIAACSDSDRALVARTGELREALAVQAGASELREQRTRLEASVDAGRTQLQTELKEVLDREADPELLPLLRDFPQGELSRALRAVEDARTRLAGLPPEPGTPEPAPAPLPGWLPAVLALLGLVSVVAGLLVGMSIVAAAGVVAIAAGGVLFARRWQEIRTGEARQAHHAEALNKWREDREARTAAVESALADARAIFNTLGPGPGALDLRLDLVGRIEGLRSRAREVDKQVEELSRVEERLTRVSDSLDGFQEFLDQGARGLGADARRHLLEQALEDASDRCRAADGAAEALERLQRDRGRDAEAHRDVSARLEGLRNRLETLGDGDVQRGGVRVAEHRRRQTHLEETRGSLEQRFPDLDRRIAAIREAEEEGVDWSADAGTLGILRAEDERLNEEDKELLGRIREREAKLEELARRDTVDELDGELEQTREEMGHLGRRRDRLWVLSRIVREAERRIRERHQPQVLRTAARYVSRLTRGRYTEFVRLGDDGRSFGVRGPGLEALGGSSPSHELEEPLSTGTREQIYMALRLAIIDELDGGENRLPLLLDEVMVNWDGERRDAGFQLLADIAGSRQCFFFTCHPEMAAGLEKHGARRIVLPDPAAD